MSWTCTFDVGLWVTWVPNMGLGPFFFSLLNPHFIQIPPINHRRDHAIRCHDEYLVVIGSCKVKKAMDQPQLTWNVLKPWFLHYTPYLYTIDIYSSFNYTAKRERETEHDLLKAPISAPALKLHWSSPHPSPPPAPLYSPQLT